MSNIVSEDKEIVSFRVPRTITEEVRKLALREDETESVILRRLLRVGLTEIERRGSGEAA